MDETVVFKIDYDSNAGSLHWKKWKSNWLGSLLRQVRAAVTKVTVSYLPKECKGRLIRLEDEAKVSISEASDTDKGIPQYRLTLKFTASAINIADVAPVRAWVMQALESITKEISGKTDNYTIKRIQCDAQSLLAPNIQCGDPCDPHAIAIIGKDSFDVVWKEISSLLDNTKDAILLNLQLSWPTHNNDLLNRCEQFAQKVRSTSLPMQAEETLSLKAPLLFRTMYMLQHIQELVDRRVRKKVDAFLNKSSKKKWERLVSDSAPGFGNINKQQVHCYLNNDPDLKGSVTWFGKQTMGELKDDCIRQAFGSNVELAVAFEKNSKVIESSTYDDTTPVEDLFTTDDYIVAGVGSE